jgi:hypothetical protein
LCGVSDNPHLCDKKDWLLLIQCNQKCTGLANSYFSQENDNPLCAQIARYLYMLQPCEKDAWEFAHAVIVEFEEMMRSAFPEDRAFAGNINYSDFNKICAFAPGVLNSIDFEHAIQDINNILLTFNGHFVKEGLNSQICEFIKQTQGIYMYNQIKEQENANKNKVD